MSFVYLEFYVLNVIHFYAIFSIQHLLFQIP